VPRLNRQIVLSNISEACEELENIEKMLAAETPVNQIAFQVAMQHAFHHLNFAWNIRHWPSKRYGSLSRTDFDEAGSFPKDLQFQDD
jgi:hypothetical protein